MHKRQMRPPRAAATLLVCMGLLLAACTRSASTAVVPTAGSAGTDVIVIPDGQDATMAAIGTEVSSQLTATAVGRQRRRRAANRHPARYGHPHSGRRRRCHQHPIARFPGDQHPVPGATFTALPPVGSICPNPYTVQQGDWIYQIARNCNVAVSALIAANPGINPNFIKPGQLLNMPGAGATPVPGGAPAGRLQWQPHRRQRRYAVPPGVPLRLDDRAVGGHERHRLSLHYLPGPGHQLSLVLPGSPLNLESEAQRWRGCASAVFKRQKLCSPKS